MTSSYFRFLLVGDPVEHSRSPVMHRLAFRLAGLDGEYEVLRAAEAVPEDVMGRLRTGDLDGVNVTMPLKTAAWEMADRLTAEAERAGSVNTLRGRDGLVEGHSTDVVAFGAAYAAAPSPAPLHVLGAGGSARAALAAWEGGDVAVSARDPGQASALAPAAAVVPWGEPVGGAVLVNATPLGMRGEALPAGPVDSCSYLIDLPYGHEPTPAVRRVEGRAAYVDGIAFLALQAAASFKWWTGLHVEWEPLAVAGRND